MSQLAYLVGRSIRQGGEALASRWRGRQERAFKDADARFRAEGAWLNIATDRMGEKECGLSQGRGADRGLCRLHACAHFQPGKVVGRKGRGVALRTVRPSCKLWGGSP